METISAVAIGNDNASRSCDAPLHVRFVHAVVDMVNLKAPSLDLPSKICTRSVDSFI
jgi:hypothetical protein